MPSGTLASGVMFSITGDGTTPFRALLIRWWPSEGLYHKTHGDPLCDPLHLEHRVKINPQQLLAPRQTP